MIRIGIVGCGRILNAHLQGFKQLRDRDVDTYLITALVARKQDDAWMFHTRGQGPKPRPPVLAPETGDPLAAPHTYLGDFQPDTQAAVHTDYRDMIDSGNVDAVLDLTPVFLHHQIGLAALDAGLHLLTQKPLAVTVKAATAMVNRAKEKRLSLGVFENARYSPAVRAARWAFESGLLGERQMALVGSLGGFWSPRTIVAQTPWRHDKLKAGGGGAIDIGVHHMDVLRYVMGEVESVSALVRTFENERISVNDAGDVIDRASVNVDDTYLAGVSFRNGAVGQMLWSWGGHGKPLDISGAPAFFGSKGCIQKNQLILDNGGGDDDLIEWFDREITAAERERFFPLGLRDEYAILQLDWLRGIEAGGADPQTSGEEGLRDLAAAFAILESAQLRRPVTLQEVLTGAVSEHQREIDERYGL